MGAPVEVNHTTQPLPAKPKIGDLVKARRELEYAETMQQLDRVNQSRAMAKARESLDMGSWYEPYMGLMQSWGQDSLMRFGGMGMDVRSNGGAAPLIRSEQDLAILRTPAIILAMTNTYAQGLIHGLTAYVIGEGYTYSADVPDEKLYPGLRAAYQAVIDEFLELNEWGANGVGEGEQPSIEVECFQRFVVSGEAGISEHYGQSGMTEVRTVEAWQITKPPGTDDREWSYGVNADPEDMQKALAYHVCYQPGTRGDIYEKDEFTYLKNNAWRTQKRGITDLAFSLSDTLRLADQLRGNLGEAAAQQAAIVGVEQPATGSTGEWTAGFRAKAAANQTDPLSGGNLPYLFVRRGMWKRIPAGFQYAQGPGATNATAHMAVLSGLLRAGATKYNAPEWLLSAEAAAQNYATSLTVNSLFVQRTKMTQKIIRGPFRSLVQRAVERRVRYVGNLTVSQVDPDTGAMIEKSYPWDAVVKLCKVKVSTPDPEYRDPLQVANKRALEMQNNVLSPQEWCAQENRDFQQTADEIRQAKELFPDAGMGFPGTGSQSAGDLP